MVLGGRKHGFKLPQTSKFYGWGIIYKHLFSRTSNSLEKSISLISKCVLEDTDNFFFVFFLSIKSAWSITYNSEKNTVVHKKTFKRFLCFLWRTGEWSPLVDMSAKYMFFFTPSISGEEWALSRVELYFLFLTLHPSYNIANKSHCDLQKRAILVIKIITIQI